MKVYDNSRVNVWSDEIMKIAINELSRLSPNFKYCVTCLIVQKRGAGLDVAASVSRLIFSAQIACKLF